MLELRLALVWLMIVGSFQAALADDPLPSWKEGLAKKAIRDFIQETTTPGRATFVAEKERIVVFDQDGTLWVEHPVYTQLNFCFDRVPALVARKPELKTVEPYQTVLAGDRHAIARLSLADLEKIAAATLTGMSTDEFQQEVARWLKEAKHPRWNRPYTELTYLPMQEVIRYFRASGYQTYIVTGGGQDFVRVYAEVVYGIPPERVVGTAGATRFAYDKDGRPILMKEPRLLLNDDQAGKPEGIHLMIGRRPYAAFGNSAGDQQMLEYVTSGDRPHLGALVLHDDARREFAYGPARELPETHVGAFPQTLAEQAKTRGWIVISMKDDWSRVFSFEQ